MFISQIFPRKVGKQNLSWFDYSKKKKRTFLVSLTVPVVHLKKVHVVC